VIAEGKHLTSDLGGGSGTDEMSAAVVAECNEI
jgi:isocitrate/isopropylmalate dehydrogenase